MKTIEEVQDKLRECINHAYRDTCEDMQSFGSNIKHLDKAMALLNEIIEMINSLKALEQEYEEEDIIDEINKDPSMIEERW